MTDSDDPRQAIDTLRARISSLSSALIRISKSLDLPTVLREVVESSRALTGARYGAIATIDESGVPQDFVTSGMSDDEHRRMAEWPEGPRLFKHFRDLPGPLRLADVRQFVRSLGFSSDLLPQAAFWGTAMRHHDVHVGNFYLCDKESGQEFTSEDEEVLLLLASQAATAIANARTHRAEQQARGDLEALVDTSPVGVVVLAARTGNLMSLNREAKRLMEGLRTPGHPPEALLKVITLRRADGREIALDQLPLARELSAAETVRGEEIELSVPDGRSITTLVNATPIRSVDGTVESVVVTMQDLGPLQELERLRAEFLGMVSHELRAPLITVKGAAATVLTATRILDPAEVRQFFRIIDQQANQMDRLIRDLLDAGRIQAGTLSVTPEPSEVAALVDVARNTFLGGGSRHTILIDLSRNLPRVMADRQRIAQVLHNLFANAARYAPATSPIRVDAVRDQTHVAISVRDEGRGVEPERLPRLFRKYGTRDGGNRGSGGGLGLAICKGLVEAHGGRIWADSAGIGQGACFTFTVPVAHDSGAAGGRARSGSGAAAEVHERTRILVVDDDPQTLRYVRDVLTAADYDVIATGDHRDLARIIETERPELVLLDLMLPDTDGIELMERVPDLADLPVIFLSAYGRDETIARALDSGATDYIVKPFSSTELTARIRAALRRRQESEPFVLGDLVIHYDQRRVTVADAQVRLTETEFQLLAVLSINADRVSTYDTLLRRVWKGHVYATPALVRAFIKRLRRKLGDDSHKPTYIVNVRGVGYRMAQPGSPDHQRQAR